MKKILHIPFTWFPEPCGGTEIYVRGLIQELAAYGWENQVAVPAAEAKSEILEGIKIHRIRMSETLSQEVLYGSGEPLSAQGFESILDAEKPTLVHFHAFSPAISVLWLEAARSRGIACVYTYHTPTFACMRGTLMRWGHMLCDGEMTPLRCSACYLHGLGVPAALSWPLAILSPVTQHLGSRVPFRSLSLTRMRQASARRWLAGMSLVVALCQWGREVMTRNAVPEHKLRVVRHGLAVAHRREVAAAFGDVAAKQKLVRFAYFGRLDQAKGLQVLAAALQKLPQLKLELHCHLIGGEVVPENIREDVAAMRRDSRVILRASVPPDQVVTVMSGYDAIVVPSIWLETGPLVVLEAFAAGVPVLGSKLGGIAEWVSHDSDGLLVRAGDPESWAVALRRFTEEPALRDRLRAGVRPPPSMADVATKMEELYHEVLS